MSAPTEIRLQSYVEIVMSRHSGQNGLCDYRACEWPCDAYVLAEHIDDHFLDHEGE